MPENESDKGDEKLLILPLGEESKKITQVISNDTARQIIELLADAPLSASDIAERLQTPLTTIVYNLENLQNVGLIKVEKIKYSEKGGKSRYMHRSENSSWSFLKRPTGSPLPIF